MSSTCLAWAKSAGVWTFPETTDLEFEKLETVPFWTSKLLHFVLIWYILLTGNKKSLKSYDL